MYKKEDRRVSENEGRHSNLPTPPPKSLAREGPTPASVHKSSEPEVYTCNF